MTRKFKAGDIVKYKHTGDMTYTVIEAREHKRGMLNCPCILIDKQINLIKGGGMSNYFWEDDFELASKKTVGFLIDG